MLPRGQNEADASLQPRTCSQTYLLTSTRPLICDVEYLTYYKPCQANSLQWWRVLGEEATHREERAAMPRGLFRALFMWRGGMLPDSSGAGLIALLESSAQYSELLS